MRLTERIRIGIVGLGWIGQEVARAAFEDPRVTLVGVADSDPAKAGRDLGELIGEGRLGVPVDPSLEGMLARARPEVAVVCTTSDAEAIAETLEICIAHGAHVVTTCENLADPELAHAQLEPRFDERARAAGLVVLSTGVNPGFAMDRLPVMLAQVTRNVRRIRVTRVVNASTRRAQLQQKIGVGMTPHGFSEAIRNGEIGHAGLSASLRLIAKGIGLHLDKTSEAFTPVLAASPTTSTLGAVASGRVRGIYQIARGYRGGREIVTLELTMALDEERPRDVIDIVGEPPIHFEGELPGDQCTVAAVLSAVAVVVTMPPGLRTVLDVPLEQPEEPAPREAGSGLQATQLPTRARPPATSEAGLAATSAGEGDASPTGDVPLLSAAPRRSGVGSGARRVTSANGVDPRLSTEAEGASTLEVRAPAAPRSSGEAEHDGAPSSPRSRARAATEDAEAPRARRSKREGAPRARKKSGGKKRGR